MIRVGLVDDHPVVLASVAAAIQAERDLVLLGAAATESDALVLARSVDVLVCDVQLDGRAEGLRILEALHDPARMAVETPPAVILLSGFEQPSLMRAAIERGAAGFLPKSAELAQVVAAIRSVASGGTAFSAAALRSTRTALRRPSDRELQVIERVRAGSTNAEVAVALGLSEKTVESHLRRLFDRYGLLSRTELAVLAIDEDWVPTRRDDP
ncbi:MAG: response regulator transcription factor [Chloroflexota bacterium]|jgi:DNA-binding NarL/FixJ family response regulator|nr:response regulator transcription factor [Chloroflexota bacterium]